jgi:hypothetical protein
VKCRASAGSKTYPWDDRLGADENHARAAILFVPSGERVFTLDGQDVVALAEAGLISDERNGIK